MTIITLSQTRSWHLKLSMMYLKHSLLRRYMNSAVGLDTFENNLKVLLTTIIVGVPYLKRDHDI